MERTEGNGSKEEGGSGQQEWEDVDTTLGHYSIKPGKKVPCLIYVTFFDEIFIYFKLTKMTSIFLTCSDHNKEEKDVDVQFWETFKEQKRKDVEAMTLRELKHLKSLLENNKNFL
jgi:hypothetical protein